MPLANRPPSNPLRQLFLFLLLPLCALTPARAETTALAIAADSSLRNALKELTQAWANSRNNGEVELELANDGALRDGIEKGQAWDVIILANPNTIKTLTASGSLQPAGQKPVAKNELVVLGHKPLITDEELEWNDLIDQEWTGVAMGDPEKVASGFYAVSAMQKRGVDKKMKSAPVLGGDDRDALANAQRDETDAVFLFRTDLPEPAIPGYDVFKIDPADYPPIIYTAALPKNSRQPALAADFIAFLQSKTAREIWKKWNFSIDN